MNLTSKVKSNFHQMWRKEKSVIIFSHDRRCNNNRVICAKTAQNYHIKKKKKLT